MLTPQQSSTSSFYTSRRFIFAIAFLAGGILAYQFIRPPTPDPSARLSAESIRELINLRNVGIAHLENDDFAPAEQAFRKIANLAPDEKMGWWNLAICTLKQIAQVRDKVKNEPPEARDAAVSKAVDTANLALQQLITHEPQSPTAYFLAAQLALELSTTPDFEHDPADLDRFPDEKFRRSFSQCFSHIEAQNCYPASPLDLTLVEKTSVLQTVVVNLEVLWPYPHNLRVRVPTLVRDLQSRLLLR